MGTMIQPSVSSPSIRSPWAAAVPPAPSAARGADLFVPTASTLEENTGLPRLKGLSCLALTVAGLVCGGATASAAAPPAHEASVVEVADAGRAAAPSLRFHEDGTFKILQITDVHFQPEAGPEYAAHYDRLIDGLLDSEKPDLVVITGDVLYWSNRPMNEYFDAAMAPMIRHQVPYAFVMGNHDAESTFTGKDILTYLQSQPGSVSRPGPAALGASGNYTVEIHGKGGATESVLYMLDSHDHGAGMPDASPAEKDAYGWLTADQVRWYGRTSEAFTHANRGVPEPSLMFFHIPLQEYNAAWSHQASGNRLEDESPQGRNTGMFGAIEAHHDVMGVFAGHDHVNDYVGSLHGVALGYGRKTGLSVYGPAPLERGGRVIVLHEGKKTFDTWIRTESGRQETPISFPSHFEQTSAD